MSSGITLAPLTAEQERVLAWIKLVWNGVTVYEVDGNSGKVIMVGHKGSEYHFSLVEADGRRLVITEPLAQNQWLVNITEGVYPLHVEPLSI